MMKEPVELRRRLWEWDLQAQGGQHYWEGANASNIDEIVIAEARKWLAGRAG
jgi:hypothetical protein